MAKYTQETDAALNTLVQAWPATRYKRMHSTSDSVELNREIILESVQRLMQFKEDFESVTATITAGTTQTQAGGTALTAEINEVSTVANDMDAVTLPTAVAGKRCLVINNSAKRLQIFPFLGDDLGEGTNNSASLSATANIMFYAFDATDWEVVDYKGATAGITAGTTQTAAGGQDLLTAGVNEVGTVANDYDTVTLPLARAGKKIEIVNTGANRLQIFPGVGDNLGYGVNTPMNIMVNENISFVAFDSTTWVQANLPPKITVGSGTGLTIRKFAEPSRFMYEVTLDYTGLSAAATNAEHTICTLPAKCKLESIIADTTVKYVGGSVSAATIAVGIAAGDVDVYIEEHDVFAAAITKGLVNADLGATMLVTNVNPVQGGSLVWGGTTGIAVQIVTTTADTDALTQGSTTYYIEYVQY